MRKILRTVETQGYEYPQSLTTWRQCVFLLCNLQTMHVTGQMLRGARPPKEHFLKEAAVRSLFSDPGMPLVSYFLLQLPLSCVMRHQPKILHSHPRLPLGNPVGPFCSSPMARDAAKSVKDCLESFISGAFLATLVALHLTPVSK